MSLFIRHAVLTCFVVDTGGALLIVGILAVVFIVRKKRKRAYRIGTEGSLPTGNREGVCVCLGVCWCVCVRLCASAHIFLSVSEIADAATT